jgi:hypothetical protein
MVLTVHVVSSTLFALSAKCGVDAIVAEGFEAGGHNGRMKRQLHLNSDGEKIKFCYSSGWYCNGWYACSNGIRCRWCSGGSLPRRWNHQPMIILRKRY